MQDELQQTEAELSVTYKELGRTQRAYNQLQKQLQQIIHAVANAAAKNGFEVKTIQDIEEFLSTISGGEMNE